MPAQSSYGSTWTNVVGTWVDTALVYDGNNTTYTYYSAGTGTSASGEVGGYGFGSGGAHEIPVGSNLVSNGVSCNIWYDVGTVARWSSVTVQAYDGATAIGTPVDITASLSIDNANNTTVVLNGVTVTHLRSANFKVRVTGVRTGSSSNTFYLRQVTVTATYGNVTMWTGTQWSPFVIWDGDSWSSDYVVWTGTAWA
jgi:hypothetical protein